jgi:hypothetical protein
MAVRGTGSAALVHGGCLVERLRHPILVVALLAAIWAGLLRIGWALLPAVLPSAANLAAAHGPLISSELRYPSSQLTPVAPGPRRYLIVRS